VFKSIALTLILGLSIQLKALAPLAALSAAGEGMELLSGMQDNLGEALDVLDLSEDLLNEFGEGEGATDELSVSLLNYNREMSLLKDDMRSLGYTDEEINAFSDRMNSSQSSLSQKMRALKRTIKSVKKLKNTFQRLFNKKGADVAVQRGILSTQQQALHLQMQQMQLQAMRDLQVKKELIASQKATENELNRTAQELAKQKVLTIKSKSNHRTEFQLTTLQKYAAMASVSLFVIGCVGLLFGLFREQGFAAIRAAVFGFILSYLLPGVVYLYRSWLGV
jgi:hypothetical protein